MPAPLGFFRLLASDRAEWRLAGQSTQRGALSELAAASAGARLLLVAPGEAVTLHRVALPSRKRSTWTRAVPYALEDQMVEDIEALHFALGSASDGDRVPVAVVDQSALRGWLEICAQVGLTPGVIAPEPLLLPWSEGDWSLLVEARRAVARTGRWEGFATERDLLELLLDQALSEAGEARPRRLRVWGDPPPHLAATSLDIQLETPSAEPLQLYAEVYRPAEIINLLQGGHGPRAQGSRWLRPWRPAAALALAWLSVQGFDLSYEHWSLRREQIALRAAMEQVFQSAVPGATRIVNPRAQLETRLRELRPASVAGGAFLDLLQRGGQALSGFTEVLLRGINYRDGQLDLNLEGGSPAALDQLRQNLHQQPELQVEMRTTQREGQVESKLTLKRTAS